MPKRIMLTDRMTRRIMLVLLAVLTPVLLLSASSATAGSGPVPVPPGSVPGAGVGEPGAPLVPGPPGSAPIGRTTATIPDLPAGVHPVPPTIRPHTVSSPPYGGDKVSGTVTYSTDPACVPNSSCREQCTAGFNAESAARIQYVLSAGHCFNDPPKGFQAHGQWFYPWDTATVIGSWVRDNYDSTGDRGAFKANKDLDNQVRTSCCIYTLTAGGDPAQNEYVCAVLGKSQHTTCGYAFWIDQHVTYSDGTDHGNLAIVQSSDYTHCPIPGDSGSPVLAVTDGVGMLSAAGLSVDGRYCYMYLDQLGYTLSSYQVFLH